MARRIAWIAVLAVIVVTIAVGNAVGQGLLQSNQGCPGGTTADQVVLALDCDAPSGRTACVIWASGFTPDRRSARIDQQYVRRVVPDNGPWCADATAPPYGDGGNP